MLCTPAPTCCQLQEKEVWPQQPVEAKEEDQVDDWIGGCLGAYAVLHTGSIGCAMATWMSLLIEDF